MASALSVPAIFAAVLLSLAARAAADHPFSLRPERTRYLLGEPAYLRMDAARGRPPALEEGTIILVIRDPEGAERAYRPPLRFRARPGGDSLAAMRGPRYARLIADGGGGWVFPRPGRYLLRLQTPAAAVGPVGGDGARSQAPGFSREAEPLSDTVSVEIAAPSASEDKRALSLISRAQREYALAIYLEGGDQLRLGMDVIRGLAAFPNAYARAADFVLCSDWAQDFRARSGGSARPLDVGEALRFARWDKSGGVYLPLRTAYRLRAAITLRSARNPGDPALGPARARLRAFEDSLTADERSILASF